MPYITEYAYTRPPRPRRSRVLIWASLVGVLGALGLVMLPFWPRASYVAAVALPNHPAVIAQAEQAARASAPGPGNWLLIPAIGVTTPIVEGPDIGVLDHATGVWRQTGERGTGNLVIAGHRFKYLPPNQTTLYNLDQLTTGDAVTLWWNGEPHVYAVAKSFTVDRDAVEILNPTAEPQLTLYTCTDLNASHRLVIIALPLPLGARSHPNAR